MRKILARVAPHPQTIIVLGAAYLGVLSGASMPHMQWWLDPTGCVPCTLLTKCLCTPPCPRAVVGCAHSFDSWAPTCEWYVAAVTGALGPTRSGPHTCMCVATKILAPRFCSTSTRQVKGVPYAATRIRVPRKGLTVASCAPPVGTMATGTFWAPTTSWWPSCTSWPPAPGPRTYAGPRWPWPSTLTSTWTCKLGLSEPSGLLIYLAQPNIFLAMSASRFFCLSRMRSSCCCSLPHAESPGITSLHTLRSASAVS